MKAKHLNAASILFALSLTGLFLISCEKDEKDPEVKPPEEIIFPDCGTISDADGNVYKTVVIGDQCWMRENLKTTRYRNGDPIPTTITPTTGISEETAPEYQWAVNGDDSNLDLYGRLYTWHTAANSRGVCPEGWRLPSDDDWKILEIALGMSRSEVNAIGSRGSSAYIGCKLAGKADMWGSNSILARPDLFGTSGFDGLPAGARNSGGSFVTPGFSTYWWTSTPGESSAFDETAYFRYLINERTGIERRNAIIGFGFPVRCVKE
jgi:uncharacterized protein (TIGR02145 family)